MWYSQLFEKKYRNLETCFCRWELFFYYCRLISRPDDSKLRWFAGCRDKHFRFFSDVMASTDAGGIFVTYFIPVIPFTSQPHHSILWYIEFLVLCMHCSASTLFHYRHWRCQLNGPCQVDDWILSNSTSRVSKGVHGTICSWLSQGLLLSTNNINLWYYYKATCSCWQWKSHGGHDCFSCKIFLWIWLNLDVLCL